MNDIKLNLRNGHPRLKSVLLMVLIVGLIGCSNASPTQINPTAEPIEATVRKSPPTPTKTATSEPAVPTDTPTLPKIEFDPADLSGVSVLFAHPFAGEGAQILREIAREFSLSNPYGIWVDVVSHGSESVLINSLQSGLEKNDLPEIIAVHPYELAVLGDAFQTIPLNNYINDPDWGLSEDEKNDIPSVFIEQFMLDGALVALPFAPQATVVFYNQTWAESLGFFQDQLENDQMFRRQACEATSANLADSISDNDGTGGWLVNWDPNVLASWYSAFGGDLPNDETPKFNNTSGNAAFDYIKSVYDEGCFWVGRQSEPYFYFANRYALMYAGTLDQIPAQKGWMDVAENTDTWTVIGFPGSEKTAMLMDGPGLIIKADRAEKQMAAWLFARYLLEPDVQEKLVRTLFTLPVRRTAIDQLEDFSAEYPQWSQAVVLVESAIPLPISTGWGIGRWVLQDAFVRLLYSETLETEMVLKELDGMIDELEGMAP